MASSVHASDEPKPIRHILLDCPSEYSLGNLYLLRCKITDQILNVRKAKKAGTAQGKVIIRGTGDLMLCGSFDLADHLQELKKFGPNDLQVLDLKKLTFKDDDLRHITGLKGLRRIDLDSTDAGDKSLKYVARLPELVSVSLARTMITGSTLSDLAPLQKLVRIELGHNAIGKSKLSGISKLKHLSTLRVQACQLDDDALKAVAQLPEMQTLIIHENNKITDVGMRNIVRLKKITFLDISHTKVTPAGLKLLAHMPLRTLRISQDQYTPAQITQVRRIFPHTEIRFESIEDRTDAALFAPLH